MNLLAKLIGTKTDVKNKEVFRLNMFDVDIPEEEVNASFSKTQKLCPSKGYESLHWDTFDYLPLFFSSYNLFGARWNTF